MAKNPHNVLVYIELDHDQLADVSLELVCKARELADRLGVAVEALLIGHQNLDSFAPTIFSYGADILYLTEDPALEVYTTLPYCHVTSRLIRDTQPQIVLFGATPIGRDLAPRVASELKTGLTADCTDLQIGDHEDRKLKKVYHDILYQIRPAFGGNIIATIVAPEHRPQMATVREGVIKREAPDPTRTGEIRPYPADLSPDLFVNTIIDRVVAERKVNLKAADIVVAGGGGVGSKENFQLIHDLAATLGGMVGASRAAVDSGYIGKEHQVGQTGTTIRPKLYIACGISGAIQHRAGMDKSGKIIAINTDPNAPIFKIAHYGIVGDLKEVIPMMIKAYKTKT
ncbi:MAG: electron transfer flavoprotein subunit alpha/FixB family protein [Candidatus Neomarinimicrobiota bacterium]|nr:MAG: electron transfer flavoprotein subunit alpha/FixB family protein [Candidatus Neomarinimicrobiota bacterium]